MKITICGSMVFKEQMLGVSEKLGLLGHLVNVPSMEEDDFTERDDQNMAEFKNRMILEHTEKIKNSDAILVLNYSKNGFDDYIGANSFLEMGVAFTLGKKIYLLGDIPNQSNRDEILGLKPVCLLGNLGNI